MSERQDLADKMVCLRNLVYEFRADKKKKKIKKNRGKNIKFALIVNSLISKWFYFYLQWFIFETLV